MNGENIAKTNGKSESGSGLKVKLLWSFVFVAIAALTIWAVTSQKDFSFAKFVNFVKNFKPVWVIASVTAMICSVMFEAVAIKTVIKSFGFNRSLPKCFIYSSGDIYFSAITPSSTGGQPASAYFMMRDGIPGSATTVSLIINLIMYSFSIIILGIVGFILKPSVFFGLSTLCKTLVIVGFCCLVVLVSFFILVIYKGQLLHKIGNILFSFLAKIRILKNIDKKKKKLESAVASYNGYVELLNGKRAMLVKALIFNILQRSSLISVTLFTYLASGGAYSKCVEVWVAQCAVILGTNVLPIPGAMGISDYMLITVFGTIGLGSVATNLNLVSRGISFYFCVLICGISLVVRMISYRFQKKTLKTCDSEKGDAL